LREPKTKAGTRFVELPSFVMIEDLLLSGELGTFGPYSSLLLEAPRACLRQQP
jgi:hypothetical protein